MCENLFKDCQNAVRIPSESGQEKNIALFIKETMEKLGYDKVWIDQWGNVIGIINGKGDDGKDNKTILLEGHMDTVGVENPQLWSVDPYSGVIKDGRLYGRGASDMKSALMAMVYAGASFIPERDELNGNIVVAGVVHEEDFEGVAQGKVLDQVNPQAVIIGESSQLKLCIGQRGRAEIQITTYGKSAHSSNPEAGINAVKKMMVLLQKIERLEAPFNEFLGKGILELTDIHSYPYPGKSVIPERCTATFDRRLLPGETKESVLDPVRALISDIQKEDPDFRAEVKIVEAEEACYTGEVLSAFRFFPAWLFSEGSSFVQAAKEGLKSKGFDVQISYYSFCTDGSQCAGIRGIPTIGFGPSRENLAHVVDEYIELEQIEKAFKGYRVLIKSLLGDVAQNE